MELVELWAMLCLLWSGRPVWHKVEMTMSEKKKRKDKLCPKVASARWRELYGTKPGNENLHQSPLSPWSAATFYAFSSVLLRAERIVRF